MKLSIAFIILFLAGCNSVRYPNWEHVRVEYKIPDTGCKYVIQETCYGRSAKCFDFYKKRATVFKANTVVLPNMSETIVSSTPKLTTLADYYACPKTQ